MQNTVVGRGDHTPPIVARHGGLPLPEGLLIVAIIC